MQHGRLLIRTLFSHQTCDDHPLRMRLSGCVRRNPGSVDNMRFRILLVHRPRLEVVEYCPSYATTTTNKSEGTNLRCRANWPCLKLSPSQQIEEECTVMVSSVIVRGSILDKAYENRDLLDGGDICKSGLDIPLLSIFLRTRRTAACSGRRVGACVYILTFTLADGYPRAAFVVASEL